MNLNIFSKVFSFKTTKPFVQTLMETFRFSFLESPNEIFQSFQIHNDDNKETHNYKEIHVIQGECDVAFYYQRKDFLDFIFYKDNNICKDSINFEFDIIFGIYYVNNIFYVFTPQQVLMLEFDDKQKERKFNIVNTIETANNIEKVLDVCVISDLIYFSVLNNENKVIIYEVEQSSRPSFQQKQFSPKNYQIFRHTKVGNFYKLYGDKHLYQLKEDGQSHQILKNVKDIIYDNQNNLFFILLNNSIGIYDNKFHQKFDFEYNFDYLQIQAGNLIAKCKGLYKNFLIMTWNNQKKKLKPLYYSIGNVFVKVNQNHLQVQILNQKNYQIMNIYHKKNLVINQRRLLIEPNLNISSESLKQFLPVNYFVKKTKYGYMFYFISSKDKEKVKFFQLQINKNLVCKSTNINILMIGKQNEIKENKKHQKKNIKQEHYKLIGIEQNEEGQDQFLIFQSKQNQEEILQSQNELQFLISVYNLKNSQIIEQQLRSSVRCYAYSKQHNRFFFGCENILIMEDLNSSNQNNFRTYRFDSDLTSIQIRQDLLLIADKRNSAHIYKYDFKKNDISYVGGDESGKYVLQAGWLNDTDVFTLNNDNTLTIFTTQDRKYHILSNDQDSLIEKQTPIPIIQESYFCFVNFQFRDRPMRFINLNEQLQKVLLDQISLNMKQFPNAKISCNYLVVTEKEYEQQDEEQMMSFYKLNAQMMNRNTLNFDLDYWNNLKNFQPYEILDNKQQEIYNKFMKNYFNNQSFDKF